MDKKKSSKEKVSEILEELSRRKEITDRKIQFSVEVDQIPDDQKSFHSKPNTSHNSTACEDWTCTGITGNYSACVNVVCTKPKKLSAPEDIIGNVSACADKLSG